MALWKVKVTYNYIDTSESEVTVTGQTKEIAIAKAAKWVTDNTRYQLRFCDFVAEKIRRK